MKQRYPLLLLIVITIVGGSLRAHKLGMRLLWFDEAVIYWISQGGFERILHQNATLNSAPPIFPVLIGVISRVQDSEAALRALPWLAGTLAIPAMYFLGRRFLSPSGAVVGAVFLALAPGQIRYSQEVREYSLSVLLTIVLFLMFLLFLERPTWKRSASLVSVAMLCLLLQYGLALMLLALNGVFLVHVLRIEGERKGILLKWAMIQAALLIGAIVVIQISLRGQWQPGGFQGEQGQHLAEGYWAGSDPMSALVFAFRATRDLVGYAFPGLVFGLASYCGVLVAFTRRRTLLPFLVAFPFLIFIAAGWLRLYPYMAARQDLILTPLIILLAALGIDYLFQVDRKFIWSSLVMIQAIRLGITPVVDYFASGEKTGLDTVLKTLTTFASPGDAVYTCRADDPVVAYYFRIRYPEFSLVERDLGTGPRAYLDQVNRVMTEHPRTWFLLDDSCGEMTPFLDYLSRRWRLSAVEERDPVWLYLAEPSP